jgi:hypothetical protein
MNMILEIVINNNSLSLQQESGFKTTHSVSRLLAWCNNFKAGHLQHRDSSICNTHCPRSCAWLALIKLWCIIQSVPFEFIKYCPKLKSDTPLKSLCSARWPVIKYAFLVSVLSRIYIFYMSVQRYKKVPCTPYKPVYVRLSAHTYTRGRARCKHCHIKH